MENEKNAGKKRERSYQGESQKESTARPNGTLRVHVVDKAGDVVRHARVKAYLVPSVGAEGAAPAVAPISGETLDTGDFVESVPAGTWNVTAEALGKVSVPQNVTVIPRCETVVPVELAIALTIQYRPSRSGGGHDDSPFSPGHSIIVATAQYDSLPQDLLEFEWFISDGSILETGEATGGAEIHIDTSGVRGKIDIEVRMSELSTSKGEK